MNRIRAKLSPGVVLGIVAIIVALSGTSIALPGKNSVDSGDLKANSVKSADIASNNVKGADVNESTLGTVPNAASANNAANASNANSVGGQSIIKVNYRTAPGPASSTILNSGGLTITATCAASANIALTATTSKQDSSIYSFVAGDGVPPAADPLEADLEGGAFDTTSNFNLLAGGGGDINLVHFVYQALDGSVVTGTIAADEFGVTQCVAGGHAISG